MMLRSLALPLILIVSPLNGSVSRTVFGALAGWAGAGEVEVSTVSAVWVTGSAPSGFASSESHNLARVTPAWQTDRIWTFRCVLWYRPWWLRPNHTHREKGVRSGPHPGPPPEYRERGT